MSEIKQTIEQWANQYETKIIDADGFPKHINWEKALFTREEFLIGAMKSTIVFGPKILAEFDKLKDEYNNK